MPDGERGRERLEALVFLRYLIRALQMLTKKKANDEMTRSQNRP